MSFSVIIPARYNSERLPGKPLIDLLGKTMIQRVYERASSSEATRVCVATDDNRVADAVRSFNGQVVMTSADHPTGTDRINEAVDLLGLPADEVVVNVQGDEPLMPPEAINQVAGAVTGAVRMATLKEKIQDQDEIFDPNIVKVVTGADDLSLYFSRAPIPWSRKQFPVTDATLTGDWFRHLGIYAYTVSMLADFVSWPPSTLEQMESLEQLRVLENGQAIRVLESSHHLPPGIDVPADVEKTLDLLKSGDYLGDYE